MGRVNYCNRKSQHCDPRASFLDSDSQIAKILNQQDPCRISPRPGVVRVQVLATQHNPIPLLFLLLLAFYHQVEFKRMTMLPPGCFGKLETAAETIPSKDMAGSYIHFRRVTALRSCPSRVSLNVYATFTKDSHSQGAPSGGVVTM